MKGFGVHTSMWTSGWTPAGAEHTLQAIKKYDLVADTGIDLDCADMNDLADKLGC